MNPSTLVRSHSNSLSTLPVISILIGAVFWGLLWWPLKLFSELGVTSNFIGVTAYTMVAIFAIPIVWRQRKLWREEWLLLLLIGIFFALANISFNTALMNGEVVRVMLLFYLLPVWGALGGVLILGERLSKQRFLGIALSLTGVVVIMGIENISWELSLADIMALSAGFFLSAAGIVNKLAIKIPMASRSFVPFIFSPLLALLGNYFSPTPLPQMTFILWILIAAFAFIWLLGATIFSTFGIANLEASRASILQVTELFVGIISAIIIGGEVLDLKVIVGGTFIITATLLEAFDVKITKKT
jgi:drug/metabolite transporter (DMT)-like permease